MSKADRLIIKMRELAKQGKQPSAVVGKNPVPVQRPQLPMRGR